MPRKTIILFPSRMEPAHELKICMLRKISATDLRLENLMRVSRSNSPSPRKCPNFFSNSLSLHSNTLLLFPCPSCIYGPSTQSQGRILSHFPVMLSRNFEVLREFQESLPKILGRISKVESISGILTPFFNFLHSIHRNVVQAGQFFDFFLHVHWRIEINCINCFIELKILRQEAILVLVLFVRFLVLRSMVRFCIRRGGINHVFLKFRAGLLASPPP
mmetsp:Transcript_31473/g.76795  ORF Transcript_31473/g.76795 Transcript_31473/m.76795 type:complete len:218 (-) Transcript_31473:196-849(-)